MIDFTAIDFETANEHWGSPCAVGLVRVRDGAVTDSVRWLMRPPRRYDYFDDFNVQLHGISPAMVASSPRYRELLPEIVEFVGGDVAVAHNAKFDSSVIRYACANDRIVAPPIPFLCTLELSRRALTLDNYKLPTVLRGLGCELKDHHDPLADARGVVDIVVGLADRSGVDDIESLARALDVPITGRPARTAVE